ncbi:hypothetical protein SAMN03159512_04717 [Pseudomonas sp. NFR09]|uniref:hypothetical protein n=1 Tax=Pseudomonas sp. NFR09 TaxID=1566249 RepID=UPI0008B4347B|nr:hypothetical protein [Pseudomonas sp. NFR09]SEU04048.1 hypothetical protein SAMN03159512_04717 [Pseudomonas sp. NFR09]
MLSNEIKRDLLAQVDIPLNKKLLICIAAEPPVSRTVAEIRSIALGLGLRTVKNSNISAILSKSKGLVVRSALGWELTNPGRQLVAELSVLALPSVTMLVVSGLRNQLQVIKKDTTRSFVDEAIKSLELQLFRSAIVLSWVGAIAVLYDAVIEKHLDQFNEEALKRDSKWRAAKSADDLCRMKEYDFLQVLAARSIIGKNVKDELEVCLKLRNGCGHPNSLVVGEHKASAHVETLLQNVFSKF